MKAIRKSDGKEIDVILAHPEEWIETEPTDNWKGIYQRDALIIDAPADWSEFRRETAKFAMAAIISNWGHGFGGRSSEIPQEAVKFADQLIEELKK